MKLRATTWTEGFRYLDAESFPVGGKPVLHHPRIIGAIRMRPFCSIVLLKRCEISSLLSELTRYVCEHLCFTILYEAKEPLELFARAVLLVSEKELACCSRVDAVRAAQQGSGHSAISAPSTDFARSASLSRLHTPKYNIKRTKVPLPSTKVAVVRSKAGVWDERSERCVDSLWSSRVQDHPLLLLYFDVEVGILRQIGEWFTESRLSKLREMPEGPADRITSTCCLRSGGAKGSFNHISQKSQAEGG